MSTLNRQELIGRVGKVKELRYTSGADPMAVCEVSLATDHTKKGEKVATWHRCVFFGKRAEAVARHSKPGTLLWLEGRTEHQEYEGRYYTKVIVERFHVLTGGVWPEDHMDNVKPSHRPHSMPGPSKDSGANPLETTGPAAGNVDPRIGAGVHHETGPPGAEFEDDIPF